MGQEQLIQTIPQELMGFERQPRTYILANGAAKEMAPRFNGNMFIVPPAGKIEATGRFGKDKDGDPIPGTRTVTDEFGINETTGEEGFRLNAEKAVVLILGVSKSGHGKMVCTSTWADRGLFLIPAGSSKEQIQGYFEQARERAKVMDVKDAFALVAEVDSENQRRREAGAGTISGGKGYEQARLMIEEAVKGGVVSAPVVQARPAVEEPLDPASELEMEVEIEAQILRMAKERAGVSGVDHIQLFEALLKNPRVLSYVRKEFKGMRRKNWLPKDLDGKVALSEPVIAKSAEEFRAEEEARLAEEQAARTAVAQEIPASEGINETVDQPSEGSSALDEGGE